MVGGGCLAAKGGGVGPEGFVPWLWRWTLAFGLLLALAFALGFGPWLGLGFALGLGLWLSLGPWPRSWALALPCGFCVFFLTLGLGLWLSLGPWLRSWALALPCDFDLGFALALSRWPLLWPWLGLGCCLGRGFDRGP